MVAYGSKALERDIRATIHDVLVSKQREVMRVRHRELRESPVITSELKRRARRAEAQLEAAREQVERSANHHARKVAEMERTIGELGTYRGQLEAAMSNIESLRSENRGLRQRLDGTEYDSIRRYLVHTSSAIRDKLSAFIDAQTQLERWQEAATREIDSAVRHVTELMSGDVVSTGIADLVGAMPEVGESVRAYTRDTINTDRARNQRIRTAASTSALNAMYDDLNSYERLVSWQFFGWFRIGPNSKLRKMRNIVDSLRTSIRGIREDGSNAAAVLAEAKAIIQNEVADGAHKIYAYSQGVQFRTCIEKAISRIDSILPSIEQDATDSVAAIDGDLLDRCSEFAGVLRASVTAALNHKATGLNIIINERLVAVAGKRGNLASVREALDSMQAPIASVVDAGRTALEKIGRVQVQLDTGHMEADGTATPATPARADGYQIMGQSPRTSPLSLGDAASAAASSPTDALALARHTSRARAAEASAAGTARLLTME